MKMLLYGLLLLPRTSSTASLRKENLLQLQMHSCLMLEALVITAQQTKSSSVCLAVSIPGGKCEHMQHQLSTCNAS